MDWIEITAKSMEEAKDKALDVLGVDERDAEFEIVEEPKAGMFGRTKGEARLRARVQPRKPRSKNRGDSSSRRPSRPRGGGEGRQSRDDRSKEGSGRREPKMERSEKGRSERPTREPREPRESRDSRPPREPREPREEVVVALDEQAKIATEFLAGLTDAFGVEAKVNQNIREEDEILEVSIDGDNLGLLIGPRGQTMTSLQEFVRIVVQRRTGATNGRIILDVAGYRERRKEALAAFANEVAADVLSTGKAKVLEPMNPADRKIVHDAINEVAGVGTSSEGMEPRRRVVISPSSGDDSEGTE